MGRGRVSVELTPAEVTGIRDNLSSLRSLLGFVVALTPAERRGLARMGTRRSKFVSAVLSFAKEHPELVPEAAELIEFEKDWNLVQSLDQFAAELTVLAKSVADTRAVAGAEALSSALVLYGWFRTAMRSVPGLAAMAAELQSQLRRRNGPPAATTPSETG